MISMIRFLHGAVLAQLAVSMHNWFGPVRVGALLWRVGCFGAACWAERLSYVLFSCTPPEKLAQRFWFYASDLGFLIILYTHVLRHI